jgi:putative oxidoreductase
MAGVSMPFDYAEARNIVFLESTSWPHRWVMKIITHVSRLLLGLILLLVGLNGLLHFFPMPPPSGIAGQFLGPMLISKCRLPVSGLQVISGALLLIDRYVPIALTILGPIIVNISCFTS